MDIVEVAKKVHISGCTWNNWSSWSSTNMDFSEPKGPYNNIWLHSMVKMFIIKSFYISFT